MSYKVEKFDGEPVRRILTAMIVNREVLAKVAMQWNKRGLFAAGDFTSNLIGGWCVTFFREFEAAPKKAIEGIFSDWLDGNRDEGTISALRRVLEPLSETYSATNREINAKHIIDIAEKFFNKVKADKLSTDIQVALSNGDLEKAEEKIRAYKRVEMGVSTGIDLLFDKEAIRSAFAEQPESIVKYSGGLGEFYGAGLARDNFVSFLGPEKRGKTFILMDVAWRAMCKRNRVAFFEIGDLTQDQIINRFGRMGCRMPNRPRTVNWPIKLVVEDDFLDVQYEVKEFKNYLDEKIVEARFMEVAERKVGSIKNSYFKLVTRPAGTMNVSQIEATLETWDKDGWTPDVVVIDYADLLAAQPGTFSESREKVNASWIALRALSQKLHCLVVTATQANAASYKAETLAMWNFSEDHRKLAHTTGMVGINQNQEEKKKGVIRLNWLTLREDEFSYKKCVYVAQCLSLAQPCVRSIFREEDDEVVIPITKTL